MGNPGSYFKLWIRGKIQKQTRHRLLEVFIKHRYWFNQGNNAMASTSLIPIEKAAVVAGVMKYLLGDYVSGWILYPALGGYFLWRVLSRWFIGYYWHCNNGYDIETEWNKGKVPPGRMELVNPDDLALRSAMYLRMDGERFCKILKDYGLEVK